MVQTIDSPARITFGPEQVSDLNGFRTTGQCHISYFKQLSLAVMKKTFSIEPLV